jgi:hypothetical protein
MGPQAAFIAAGVLAGVGAALGGLTRFALTERQASAATAAMPAEPVMRAAA